MDKPRHQVDSPHYNDDPRMLFSEDRCLWNWALGRQKINQDDEEGDGGGGKKDVAMMRAWLPKMWRSTYLGLGRSKPLRYISPTPREKIPQK